MYGIAFFGFLMMLLSIVMITNPEYWSNGIVKFSKKPYFHPFEILSRLAFGVVFIMSADQTLYPSLMLVIGYLLIAVGAGLLLIPPSKHRQFAVWSARKFKNTFRPMGFGSLFFGAFLVYAALSG
ncbi:MAG: hypothetical protein HKN57_13020 [Xanthomonadales bacterium]|nr:hypothetical protein [Gammaproteobacteria bacterium]NND58159.1 hypothetical protein [Xanthomonadales bacterium]NNK52520.1 hypothetical protein [Xanthomonadales bacterium]